MTPETAPPPKKRRPFLLIFIGIIIGAAFVFTGKAGIEYTSTDTFCDQACHIHPHATQSWIKSTHYTTKSGVVTHCIQCHLPGEGFEYYTEKARLGAQDVYGKLFKDASKLDWLSKRSFDTSKEFTYDSACIKCHSILFSAKLSKKGVDGHLHYQRAMEKMRCISCHLTVGHFQEKKADEGPEGMDVLDKMDITSFPANPEGHKNYTETLPGSDVKFEMAAIPGGTFEMGSPASEPMRNADEGPAHKVQLSPFWMGKTEVRWREWEVFYAQRGTAGHPDEKTLTTGPTPPYGSPDQGWGKGGQPAITMTHHAAMVYCEWLSEVTGKRYRLPTEAEWEYACRAGAQTPYFFAGDPAQFTARSWWNHLLGPKTEPLAGFAWYKADSNGRSHPPTSAKPNPWGLYNVLGNVREFCLDYYDAKAYAQYPADGVVMDPRGPENGKERVVRGGSFKTDGADLRAATRDHTQHDAWLFTDPQSPKSIWWYSDCVDVGFRVVRELDSSKPFLEKAKPPVATDESESR